LRDEILDARAYAFAEQVDVIIAHGFLHLLPRPDWSRLIQCVRRRTKISGFKVVAVCTGSLASPGDLGPFMLGLFRDERRGGLRHRRPVEKVAAQNSTTCLIPPAHDEFRNSGRQIRVALLWHRGEVNRQGKGHAED
jgi:putative intracellular protease/amidase